MICPCHYLCMYLCVYCMYLFMYLCMYARSIHPTPHSSLPSPQVVFPLLQQREEDLLDFEHDPQEYIRRMQGQWVSGRTVFLVPIFFYPSWWGE